MNVKNKKKKKKNSRIYYFYHFMAIFIITPQELAKLKNFMLMYDIPSIGQNQQ